jgi:hypothetical protein
MTDRDLNYLKRATPAELMKLTNGIPWELCCLTRVDLTSSKPLTLEQLSAALLAEKQKWVAAGAASDTSEIERWMSKGSEQCAECGGPRHEAKTRFSFTLARGFGWHKLCGNCAHDFDNHSDPRAWAKSASELAARWQGRCLTRREVAR